MKTTLKNKYFFIKGICKIIDGLINVLSFGFLNTDITFSFCKWAAFRTGWNN